MPKQAADNVPTSDSDLRLAVEYVPIEQLIPYARNARTHSDAQVAQIAASIREFGFVNPCLVDGARGLIAGHGRVLAARKLGLTEVPTIELSHLTPVQRRAYVLADNRLALTSAWDTDMLAMELGDLHSDGFNLETVGWNEADLRSLLGDDPTIGKDAPDEFGSIDETIDTEHECPSCGYRFSGGKKGPPSKGADDASE